MSTKRSWECGGAKYLVRNTKKTWILVEWESQRTMWGSTEGVGNSWE
jgi:hypothetical protein